MARPEKKPLGAAYWQQLAGHRRRTLSERFRPFLACPDDDAPLEYNEQRDDLTCPSCSRVYTDQGGWLDLLPAGDPYQVSENARALLEQAAKESPAPEPPPLWDRALAWPESWQDLHVLDVGCGRGWAAAEFARRGAIVAAADIVSGEGGLATALDVAQREELPVDCFRADVCRLPFVPGTFDVVFACDLIHRLRRPERLLKEVGRVLKPEGVFLSLGEPVRQDLPAHTDAHGFHGHRLTLGDLGGILHEGGLEMEAVLPGDNGARTGGWWNRARRAWRQGQFRGRTLLVGRQERPFELPRLPNPWQRKEEQHE